MNGDYFIRIIVYCSSFTNILYPFSDGIFSQKMLAIPDGFLVPFKTNGAIKLVDVTTPGSSQGPYVLTSNSGGDWFYHRVEWQDMDGDGDQDIVTCRAREPLIPGIFGQFGST